MTIPKQPKFSLPGTKTTIYSNDPKFKILNPGGGEIYKKGSTIHIFWEDGPPIPQSLRIWLVDQTMHKIIDTNLPEPYYNNSVLGHYMWTIPTNIKIDTTHNFQMYIEDEARRTWTFGQIFRII